MASEQQRIIKSINELIKKGEELKEIKFEVFGDTKDPRMNFKDLEEYNKWKVDALYLIKKLLGEEDHYENFININERYFRYSLFPFLRQTNPSIAEDLHKSYMAQYLSILRSFKTIVEKGLLVDLKTLVAADVFDSLLQQIDYLLSQNYKDCVAILCRVVIEDTLKQLCKMNNISCDPKTKASELNTLLKNNAVYQIHIWRDVQAKLDIGNLAAHGRFNEFRLEEVQEMYKWTKKFIEKHLIHSHS